MAIQHYYAGPATVKVATRTPGNETLTAYGSLGINRESIPIVIQPKFLDVPSDDWAGADGAPADAQFMGGIAIIQLSLTKFERADCDRLLDGYLFTGSVAGSFIPFGSFMRQESRMFSLQLDSTGTTKADERLMTFTHCFVRGGGAVGQGTRYSSYDMTIEAWMNSSTARLLYTLTYS